MSSVIKNNGTQNASPSNLGTEEGCLLSPFLLNNVLEVLLLYLLLLRSTLFYSCPYHNLPQKRHPQEVKKLFLLSVYRFFFVPDWVLASSSARCVSLSVFLW